MVFNKLTCSLASSFTSPNKGPLTAPSEEIITATENGMIGENCLLGTGSESNVTDGKDAKSDAVQQSKCAHVRWKGSC